MAISIRRLVVPLLLVFAAVVVAVGEGPRDERDSGPRGARPTLQMRGLRGVGVARVDITPDYPVRLSGFAFRKNESEGVRQKIWAKALAIGTEANMPAVLITVDNLGVPARMVEELAARLGKKAGLEPDRLAVTSSHTHTAPMLTGVCPTLFGEPIAPE